MSKIELNIIIDMSAKDLDEALVKSKDLNEHDFVDILGEYMDGKFRVTGVYERD